RCDRRQIPEVKLDALVCFRLARVSQYAGSVCSEPASTLVNLVYPQCFCASKCRFSVTILAIVVGKSSRSAELRMRGTGMRNALGKVLPSPPNPAHPSRCGRSL